MSKKTDTGFTPEEISLDGFIAVLNYDMQRDLPAYFEKFTEDQVKGMSVADVINFNDQDTTLRAPYGQGRLIASRDDETPPSRMDSIKNRLEDDTWTYYHDIMKANNLDAILSINNRDAAYAAVAKYPCLAMPMGYQESGEPRAMTFIGPRFGEKKLLQIGHAFEQVFDVRKAPSGF